MSTEQIVAELVLDDGKYVVRMNNASRQAKAFKRDMERLNTSVERSEKKIRGATAAVRDWSIIIGQSRNVIHQLWFVTGQWMTSLINTNAEIERMTRLMEGMSKAETQMGKAAEAAENVKTLFETAKNAPFSINALSDSFVKFKSVGLDPLDGSMQSLVDATAAFGGTDETLHRASIAIQQMAGKGVISMEELRQQLGEAVPQAITIMAESLGTSYGDLVKLISEGKVLAEPALKAMFGGFQLTFGGRAQNLMDSYNGRLAQMKTAWIELVTQSPGIQNFFESVKDMYSTLTDLFQSATFADFANSVGNGLGFVVQSISDSLAYIPWLNSQMRGFFDLINSTRLSPDSLLYQVMQGWDTISFDNLSFGIVEDALKTAEQILGAAYEESVPLLFGEDVTPETLQTEIMKKRLASGQEIMSEEFGSAIDAYDQHIADIDSKKELLAKAEAELNQSIIDNAKASIMSGEEIFSQEQYNAALDLQNEFLEKSQNSADLAKSVLSEIEEVDRKIQEARERNTSENGSVHGASFRWETRELQEARAELEEQYRQHIAAREEFHRKMRQVISARVEAEGNSTTGSFSPFGEMIDESQINRLGQLTESIVDPIRSAAAEVFNLRREIDHMEGDLEGMASTIGREIEETARDLMDPYKDQANDIRNQFGSVFDELRAKNAEIFTDGELSQEDKIAQMEANNAAFIESQIAEFARLQEAAQAALGQQGEAGMEAAAIFAQFISGLIAQLQSQVSSYASNLKQGVVLVSGKPSSGKTGGGSGRRSAMGQLESMIDSATRKAEELERRLVDPFAYELPKAIDKARVKIGKLADKISGGKWTQEMHDLFRTIATNEMTEELLDMADATRDIRRSLMGESHARKEIYEEEVARIANMKAQLTDLGIWRVEWERIIQEQLTALQEEFMHSSPIGEYMLEWKNLFDDVSQWGADAMGDVSQAIADMVTEGEADFAQLARSALNSFLQIQFNAALSGLTDLVSGQVGKIFAGVNHSGAIAGMGAGRSRSVPASVFAMAPRYHTGGIAGNEVPAILERGEGVFTQEQMKALGIMANRGSEKDVKVNLINNSGVPLDSEETKTRMDPNGMVLDIVLKEVKRPGPFRDSMKRALK